MIIKLKLPKKKIYHKNGINKVKFWVVNNQKIFNVFALIPDKE